MTTQHRLEIYQEMLQRIESGKQEDVVCLCGTLHLMYASRARQLDFKSKPENFSSNIIDYPELVAQKPQNPGLFWWGSKDATPRIECLKQAIIACENKILEQNSLS